VNLKSETLRKLLHLAGLLIPISYFIFGKNTTLLFLSIALVIFLVAEPYRISRDTTKKIIQGIRPLLKEETFRIVSKGIEEIDRKIREITRKEEEICIAAHVYFSIASLLVILFSPKMIAMGVISAATVGDALAAIVGIRWGFHRFKNGKSLEGSVAFFLSSFFVLLLFLNLPYAIIGAVVGTISELYNFPPNDNFSNQLVMAFFVNLASYLFSAL